MGYDLFKKNLTFPSTPALGISNDKSLSKSTGEISGVSGQAAQQVPLGQLKLSIAVYGQRLDGRPSR